MELEKESRCLNAHRLSLIAEPKERYKPRLNFWQYENRAYQ